MQAPNAQQVWDQSWWDAQGFVSPPLDPYQNPAPNNISFDPAQLAYQKNYHENWKPPIQVNPGSGGGAPGGGSGGSGSGSPFGTINTSITPRSVYSPWQTQVAVNQAVADSRISPNSVYKRFDRPGVSRSQSTKYRAAPTLASGFSLGQQQAAGIPLGDEIANQQNLMQGQLAKHQEFTGLAGLLLKQLGLGQMAQQSRLGNVSALMSLLGSFV